MANGRRFLASFSGDLVDLGGRLGKFSPELRRQFQWGISQGWVDFSQDLGRPTARPPPHRATRLGNVSETPTPTTCLKSTAVHLQFVRQYAPHLYRRTFLVSKLRRKGNSAVRLPFVLQYASHLYGSTPPICTAILLEKYWGLGSPERF